MTDWKEFSVYVNEEAEDSVSQILMELGSNGVNIINQKEIEKLVGTSSNLLWELDENKFPEKEIIVKGYFHQEKINDQFYNHLYKKLENLKEFDLNVKSYQVEERILKDEDWKNNWKEYYHPVPITRYLTIVPEWEEYQPKTKKEELIILDPGLAFGTGTHPTTQLAIQGLETVMRGGEQVMDVGTGSGVLTIVSSILGANEVFAYDLDEMAVKSAQSNIALNNLAAKIHVEKNDLLTNVEVETDIIVANILTHILLDMISDAMNVLRPGGYFITSGIFIDKKLEMIKALEAEFFEIQQINQIGDWIGIISQKPRP